jgi:hypothetical protein
MVGERRKDPFYKWLRITPRSFVQDIWRSKIYWLGYWQWKPEWKWEGWDGEDYGGILRSRYVKWLRWMVSVPYDIL